MITKEEVKQLVKQLPMDDPSLSESLFEDVEAIVYRCDTFAYGEKLDLSRHIDIEFDFGDYYEVHEETPLFQVIAGLWDQPLEGEEDIVLYQK